MKWTGIVVFGLAASVARAEDYQGLGAESVSAAEVAKFAPPPLPEAVERRIQALLDVRGAADGTVTKRGDRVFFTSKITGQQHVWRQDKPMGFAVQLTGGDDKTSVAEVAPDDSFVVVARDIGGQENPGLYLLDPDGGPLRLVQHTPKVQTTLEFVSEDSKSLVFRANDIDVASYALYRWDVATGKRELLLDQPGLWQVMDHRGTQLLLARFLGNTVNEIYRFDLETKQLTPVIGVGKLEQYDVRFGAKADMLLVRTNQPSEFYRLYTLKAGTQDLVPITPEATFDVDSLGIDDARQRIYYTTNESGYSRAHVLDARTYKPIALPKLPAADHVKFAAVSHGGRYVSLALDGPRMPGQSLVLDWKTKKLTTWRTAMTPEVDVSKFAPATLESYPARDGTQIPMFVRRPDRCTATVLCPVVVEFHGGPESQARAGFSPSAQAYVDAGFILVQPNVRGSFGYGKKWLHADDGPRRLAVITDIEDAAIYLRKAWAVGGKAPRIGVTGGSYGGYSTLMAMTYFAGAFDAGVQSVGMSNLKTFLANTAAYRRILRISEYGDPVRDADALARLSPITHIAKLRAPLLSIQGVNDPRVPVGEALQFYREAERRKIPGGLILFPDEGHGASKRGNQALQIGHTIAFFEKYLK